MITVAETTNVFKNMFPFLVTMQHTLQQVKYAFGLRSLQCSVENDLCHFQP